MHGYIAIILVHSSFRNPTYCCILLLLCIFTHQGKTYKDGDLWDIIAAMRQAPSKFVTKGMAAAWRAWVDKCNAYGTRDSADAIWGMVLNCFWFHIFMQSLLLLPFYSIVILIYRK